MLFVSRKGSKDGVDKVRDSAISKLWLQSYLPFAGSAKQIVTHSTGEEQQKRLHSQHMMALTTPEERSVAEFLEMERRRGWEQQRYGS